LASHDDDVGSRRQVLTLERERLAQEPFNQIPVYRAADLSRHRQPKAWRRVLVAPWKHVEHELSARV
jgi:hypothetical protein